jgi:hypothetical protein
MNITTEVLAERLNETEKLRDEALRAAQHYEGRSAELRHLIGLINTPEPKKEQDEPQATE